jgi:hypothetical protein
MYYTKFGIRQPLLLELLRLPIDFDDLTRAAGPACGRASEQLKRNSALLRELP